MLTRLVIRNYRPARAREHFYGLREAKPDLLGVALYDRLDVRLNDDPYLAQLMWKRREIENYLATRDVLRAVGAVRRTSPRSGGSHERIPQLPSLFEAMHRVLAPSR